MANLWSDGQKSHKASVALRFIRSSRGLGAQDVRWTSALRGPEWNGDFPQQAKMRRVYTGALLSNLQKK